MNNFVTFSYRYYVLPDTIYIDFAATVLNYCLRSVYLTTAWTFAFSGLLAPYTIGLISSFKLYYSLTNMQMNKDVLQSDICLLISIPISPPR